MKILVNGASKVEDVPGLDVVTAKHDVVFAPDATVLGNELPGTEVLLGWNFRGNDLEDRWSKATDLKWIHWCGAGVDAVLFPALAQSDVILTNAHGIFNQSMGEFALGFVLSEAKSFRQLAASQIDGEWDYHLNRKVAGTKALVFGVGGIGRETGRLFRAVGIEVDGVGRSSRAGDEVFGKIVAQSESKSVLKEYDWIIGIMPSTAETDGFFDASFFDAMAESASFLNMGRGRAVDEEALADALGSGSIASAMLDVFKTEPLPKDSPLWSTRNLVISPHMSGDYSGYHADMAKQFYTNLENYEVGRDLFNVVDKVAGFVRSS